MLGARLLDSYITKTSRVSVQVSEHYRVHVNSTHGTSPVWESPGPFTPRWNSLAKPDECKSPRIDRGTIWQTRSTYFVPSQRENVISLSLSHVAVSFLSDPHVLESRNDCSQMTKRGQQEVSLTSRKPVNWLPSQIQHQNRKTQKDEARFIYNIRPFVSKKKCSGSY